ncbi:hypothetical protein BT63DRAFT_454375 [Microthyrium microscopicum]|uniref:Zn(2)-C6 fungal-type domain-containing protein n=1 Tax=Microthyrium microscopicum TaxID=703497 RepID=A0A6A6UFG7_9PEZI|nr:hypothetical protein BT63DRAFT_454375 [Microthyrium microscopicum]
MVFPSPACLTCKTRRVKCDTARPACDRCQKAGRVCSYGASEQYGLPFRNENDFAKGKRRRPRKNPVNTNDQNLIVIPRSPSSVPPLVAGTIEHVALQYWTDHFAAWPTDLFEFGHEYGSYALCYWNCVDSGSSLYSALSAFSLALFGQAKHSNEALDHADKFYGKSIIKTQQEIKKLSSDNIDQLLVAISLMAIYENLTSSSGNQHPPSSHFDNLPSYGPAKIASHLEGMAALLLTRKEHAYPRNLPLEQATRRTILRTSILRGRDIPDWLQDGTLYGEQGINLGLDALMVSTATLQSKASRLLKETNVIATKALHDLIKETRKLDSAFENWSLSVPVQWGFTTLTLKNLSDPRSRLLYEETFHNYQSSGHATLWNRYRATRVAVNHIWQQALGHLPSRSMTDYGSDICQKNLDSLATDLCHSIPFFFNSFQIEDIKVSEPSASVNFVDCEPYEITPMMSTVITWPLAVVIKAAGISKAHRIFLEDKLKIIAEVIGLRVQ